MINNYNDYNDSELVMMIKEENESAKDILYNKYNYLINVILKKYMSIIKKLNIDYKEIYQEAMLGFADALDKYDDTKDASIKTFISLCVERRIHTTIVKYSTKKHQLEKECLSIDYVYENFKEPLSEIIKDTKGSNPLESLEEKENIENIINVIEKTLSQKEQEVFNLMLDGLNYQEIAEVLKENTKSIDNTIQRIKRKARQALQENNK